MCAFSEAAEPLQLPLQRRRRRSATCRASVWVSQRLVHSYTSLFRCKCEICMWHTPWHLTEGCTGISFPKNKRKGPSEVTCLMWMFHYAGLWGTNSAVRMGLEKEKNRKKIHKFLFLSLFTDHFSVGSVAIALKTILHALVKGVFVSLWRPIRMREMWWSHPACWPHILSLSSSFAHSFWDARTYGRRDSCLLIIITLQRKCSATSAPASLTGFIPCVSSSVVK